MSEYQGFSNEDTESAFEIINNTYNLYMNRKTFQNHRDFENFFSKKKEIYTYAKIENVNWREVWVCFMDESDLLLSFILGRIFYPN